MSLKIKIAARLKVKAAGVNLSQKRIDAIVSRAEKGLADESDDAAIDASLDAINELTPFKEIASLDDHQRAKEAKEKLDKEKADKEAAERAARDGDFTDLPADTPEWMRAFMKQQAEQNRAMQAEIASIKGEKVTTTRREQFIKSMEGTSAEYQARELKKFDRIAFRDDEDFKTFLDDIRGDHAAAVQEDANGELGKDRPAGGGSGDANRKKEATEAEVETAFANLKI